MKRLELEHGLRASAAITTDPSFVVIGSRSVLLSHPASIDARIRRARRRAQEATP